jgi:dihydrolipoamide dehydrogenase
LKIRPGWSCTYEHHAFRLPAAIGRVTPVSEAFDVIVIGAGPAGYPAAIRAGQNKLTVACVDEWQNTDGTYAFGGTCLNAGCIPSKALLESSELYQRAKDEFAIHGIRMGDLSLDLGAMQKRRASVVKTMTNGINALFKANGVVGIQGHGRLLPGNRVLVKKPDGTETTLEARHVILASGSTPIRLRAVPHDGKHIVDSWNALEFDSVPRRLGVIGAGVIGLELGSVWRRLGSEVVVLEAMQQFLPMVDQTIAKEALRHFKKQGLDIKLGATVKSAAVAGDAVDVVYADAQGEHSLQVDKLIVAVGRRPYTQDLLAPDTGVAVDERGFIQVDEHCRTNVPNVWAVGDVVRGPMLAHKGKEEGVMVADLIAGQFGEVNYKVIPSVIYTAPEIAWVGQTEEQVKAGGRAYKVGTFPFAASGRARAMAAAAGMVKMVSAKDDDEVLGIHVIGPMAGELIGEAVLAMEYSASTEDIQRTIHAHPTLSEAIHEAALAVDKKAIDGINR